MNIELIKVVKKYFGFRNKSLFKIQRVETDVYTKKKAALTVLQVTTSGKIFAFYDHILQNMRQLGLFEKHT